MGMLGSVRLIGRWMNKSRDEFIFHRSGFLDSFGYVRRLTYPKNCTKRYKWPKMIFLRSHLSSNFFFWCVGIKVLLHQIYILRMLRPQPRLCNEPFYRYTNLACSRNFAKMASFMGLECHFLWRYQKFKTIKNFLPQISVSEYFSNGIWA